MRHKRILAVREAKIKAGSTWRIFAKGYSTESWEEQLVRLEAQSTENSLTNYYAIKADNSAMDGAFRRILGRQQNTITLQHPELKQERDKMVSTLHAIRDIEISNVAPRKGSRR